MENRIIKFRAWDAHNKEMIPNYCELIDNMFHGEDLTNTHWQTPVAVMQYTGLRDKNGKDIYELDIVSRGGLDNVMVVQWKDSSCGFEPFSDSDENCGHCGGGVNPKDFEVVGNYFEHPELITPRH